MTWPRQVWHVFAKDVRRHWWMLVLFVVHVFAVHVFPVYTVAAMNGATQAFSPSADSLGLTLLFFLLPVTAAVLAAMVVLDDPPVSASAWWPTLALSRQAVFSAKLLFILGLMPLVLVVAMMLMHSVLGLLITEALMLSLQSARWFLLLLTVTVAVASLAKDLRAFVLASALLLGGLVFFLNLLVVKTAWILEWLVRITPSAVLLTSVLLGTSLLVTTSRVYRSRSHTWHRFAFVLLLVPLLVLAQIKSAEATVRPSSNDSATQLEQATIKMEMRRLFGESDKRELLTRVELRGLASNVQAAVYVPSTQLNGPASCGRVLTLAQPFTVLQSPALPVPGSPVRWRGKTTQTAYSADSLHTRIWGDRSQIRTGCTLAPRAEVHLRQPILLGRMPVTLGASLTRHGYRVIVLSANGQTDRNVSQIHGSGLITVSELSGLPTSRRSSDDVPRPLSYVLLHPGRREAIELQPTNNRAFALRGPVSQYVLALEPRHSETVQMPLSASSDPEWESRLEFGSASEWDEWLRGAELMVFEWKLTAVIDPEVVTVGTFDGSERNALSGKQ